MHEPQPVIGLEVHVQLLTQSKAFCACGTATEAEPNTQCCPVCLGHPGALPVLNDALPRAAVLAGLATGCRVRPTSTFARKHYFYPDLPKGYQITQFEDPICHDGSVRFSNDAGEDVEISITRIHMEEDAARLQHTENATLVDYNRCGIPLLEIVTGPDFNSPEHAAAFLKQLRQLVRYLGISDGNMQEGSLRCDANISLQHADGKSGTRTEIKNLNSFRGVERALTWEIARQRQLIDEGQEIESTTLLWDEDSGCGRIMRAKESSVEYHYLSEPDLPPVLVTDAMIANAQAALPESPNVKRKRFMNKYALSAYDAEVLTEDVRIADYFENVTRATGTEQSEDGIRIAHFITGEVFHVMRETQSEIPTISAERLAALLRLQLDGRISGSAAKTVFANMHQDTAAPEVITERLGLFQMNDRSALHSLVQDVVKAHPDQLQQYLDGNIQLLGFFVGQIMQRSKGTADPRLVNTLLQEQFDARKDEEN